MGKKEVVRAITFRNPRRIPRLMHWYAGETIEKYRSQIEELKRQFPDDILVIGPKDGCFVKERYKGRLTDTWYDMWECKWRKSEDGVGYHLISGPLYNWNQLDVYLQRAIPLITDGRWVRIEEIIGHNLRDKFIVGQVWRTYFERMWMLRGGMENLMIDLYQQRNKVLQLRDALIECTLVLIRQFARKGVDGIFLADDWGSQDTLLINPNLWREIFKPGYKKMFEAIHKEGMYVFFHSDGNVFPIIKDLIECGLDVLNPLQTNSMNIRKISQHYAGKLCFLGAIDVQHLLTKASASELIERIKRIVGFLNKGGGYIATPESSIMPETPFENIRLACETIASYRFDCIKPLEVNHKSHK